MENRELMVNANRICHRIEKRGYQALITGGAVRDMVLGLEPHDIDVATNMPISKLDRLFKTYNIGKSKDFGIVVVEQGGFQFEIAQFRKDGSYSDGRRPDNMETVSSFVEDAARRDFTINAMGLTQDGKVLDYYGGTVDL
jgi:tRNA nucleotidyltransferase (CCA-adding enzyme)